MPSAKAWLKLDLTGRGSLGRDSYSLKWNSSAPARSLVRRTCLKKRGLGINPGLACIVHFRDRYAR